MATIYCISPPSSYSQFQKYQNREYNYFYGGSLHVFGFFFLQKLCETDELISLMFHGGGKKSALGKYLVSMWLRNGTGLYEKYMFGPKNDIWCYLGVVLFIALYL